MANLLLHSMAEFSEIILPALELTGARDVVEVGAEYGTMTRTLLDYVDLREGSLSVIDPVPSPKARAMFTGRERGRLIEGLSLDAMPGLTADAWLMDGDHNHYTVLRESEIIWKRSREAERPFLAFYHDVAWPWGRRDLYYDPERIPEAHRHPHSFDHGVVPEEKGVVEGGFRGEGQWACALHEGGPANGVLTAIEDFVEGKQGLMWATIPAVFGLGVLFADDAPWTDSLKNFLLPFHMNPLLERMERNRLDCYLRVIAWQDQTNEERDGDGATASSPR